MTRTATRFWFGYLVFWLLLGIGIGAVFFSWFPYGIYFAVPMILFGAIGVIPTILAFIWMTVPRGRHRRIAMVAYLVLLALIWHAPAAYRAWNEEPGNDGPYIYWSDDPRYTITIAWTTASPHSSRVQIEHPGGELRSIEGGQEPGRFHRVVVDGLAPDTAYRYRVPALGTTFYPFRTAPEEDVDFAFAAYGDNRPWSGITMHRRVVDAMLRYEPEDGYRFILNTGDIVENPDEGYGWQWRLLLRQIQPLAATRPYMIAVGNHEVRRTTDYFVRYFDYGGDQFWYGFDYAGVHFMILSTEHDLTPGSEQYEWMRANLEAHAEDARFVIASFHRPLMTYDPRDRYDEPERLETLLPVFQEYGVDLVLAGHVHAYERHLIDGLHHVITGGGGVLLWFVPETGPKTVATETRYHFCVIHVREDVMELVARRIDGTVIDRFEIPRRNAVPALGR